MHRDDAQNLEMQALRKAKADLETLVETSPVDEVVFDAKTGAPLSVNREMRRIVEALRDPAQPPEQLLVIITVRRADGREVSQEELPLAQVWAPERRCAPRRSSCGRPTAAASGPCSTPRPSAPRMGRWSPSWWSSRT